VAPLVLITIMVYGGVQSIIMFETMMTMKKIERKKRDFLREEFLKFFFG
jgi:hypothetical protein